MKFRTFEGINLAMNLNKAVLYYALLLSVLIVADENVKTASATAKESVKITKLRHIETLEGHCGNGVCRNFHYGNVDEVAFFDVKAEIRITPESTYDIRNPVERDSLVFENSTFAHFPIHLFYTATLREVDMRNCSVQTITWENFLMAYNLRVLLLSNNKIRTIEGETFLNAEELQYLFLDYNQIEDLVNKSFAGLSKLRYLDLAHNRLKHLPPNIFDELQLLSEIHLESNQLRNIENEVFINNHDLLTVTLAHNNLRQISEYTFKNQANLLLLDVSHNDRLEILVINVNAQNLIAANCSLYRVNIYGSTVNVDMRDNQILELYFSQPEKLETLNLRNNAIEQIASLTRATQLRTLDLSDNPKLGILTDSWAADSLEQLDLSNTSIKMLPWDIIAGSKLYKLNVSHNKLREINPQNFKYMERLKHFYLHANDWNCYNLRLVMELVIRPQRISYQPDIYDPEFPGEYIHDIACMYRLEEDDDDDNDNGSQEDDRSNGLSKQPTLANLKEDPIEEVRKLRSELKAIVGFYETKFDRIFEMMAELKKRVDRYDILNETIWQNVAISF